MFLAILAIVAGFALIYALIGVFNFVEGYMSKPHYSEFYRRKEGWKAVKDGYVFLTSLVVIVLVVIGAMVLIFWGVTTIFDPFERFGPHYY